MAFKPRSGALTFCKAAQGRHRGGLRLRGRDPGPTPVPTGPVLLLSVLYIRVLYEISPEPKRLATQLEKWKALFHVFVPDSSIHSGQTLGTAMDGETHACGGLLWSPPTAADAAITVTALG